jgi:hypothetical protein
MTMKASTVLKNSIHLQFYIIFLQFKTLLSTYLLKESVRFQYVSHLNFVQSFAKLLRPISCVDWQ